METVKEKDYLPTSSSELADQKELVSSVARLVKVYNEGLNEDQQQILREMYADLKGIDESQPDWTDTNYLELMLEMVYIRGCAFGHIKGMSQMHNSYTGHITSIFNKK